jgi:hypothetical protein
MTTAAGRWRAAALALLLALGLTACAIRPARAPAPVEPAGGPTRPATGTPPPGAAAPVTRPPEAAAPVTRPPGAAAPARPPEQAAIPGRGRPAPIPDRRIDLDGRCAQTEEDGYREDASLRVRDNEVQSLSWQLWVGRKGSCRFEQGEFRQTRSRPHIEMTARDGSGCRLMVWQDPRRVTLAHADCQKRCTAGIYEQAWPVMFDPASGACARTDR